MRWYTLLISYTLTRVYFVAYTEGMISIDSVRQRN